MKRKITIFRKSNSKFTNTKAEFDSAIRLSMALILLPLNVQKKGAKILKGALHAYTL